MNFKISHIYFLIFTITIFNGVIARFSSVFVDYFIFFLSIILYIWIVSKSISSRFNKLGLFLFLFTLITLIISLIKSDFSISILIEWYTDIRFLPLFVLPFLIKVNFDYKNFNKFLFNTSFILSILIIFQYMLFKLGYQLNIAQVEVLNSVSNDTKLISAKIGSQSGIFSRAVEASYFILLVFLNTLTSKKFKLYEIFILGLGIFFTFKRLPFLIFSVSVLLYVIKAQKARIIILISFLVILLFPPNNTSSEAIKSKRNEVSPATLFLEIFGADYWERSSSGSRIFIVNTFLQNLNSSDLLIGRGINFFQDFESYVDEINIDIISNKLQVIKDVEIISIALKYGLVFSLLFIIFLKNQVFRYYQNNLFMFKEFYFIVILISMLSIRFFNVGIISLLFWYYLGFKYVEKNKV